MPNLLIRDVPNHIVETLKGRAKDHRRSLQQELLDILELAADRPSGLSAGEVASAIRERLVSEGISFADSAPLIRRDRER